MEFNEEQLQEIEDFAYALLPPEDIAEIVGCSYDCFKNLLQDLNSPVRKAFRKGQLRAKASMHLSLVKSAEQGSHPAYVEATKLLKAATEHEFD